MKVLTFKRGVHPHDEKIHSQDRPVEVIMPEKGSVIVIPMQQHIGAPCQPVVTVGERVLLGQKVGEAKAHVSAPVHASVSGVVKEIKPCLTPAGVTCTGVFIENDGTFEELPAIGENNAYEKYSNDYKKYPREKCLEIIKEAGIVGLGGAGFPAHVKLNPPPDKKIDTIIINAAECEPFLTTDYRVLIEESEKLLRGLRIILRMFPEARGIIGVETNKMPAIEKLNKLCANMPDISVAALKPKYPQGAEKQLIYACTKREAPSGGLPHDVGCLVQNADTVVAIERAIVRGRPLMRKIVTVTGDAVKNPGNYKVRLGMSHKELIERTGGFKSQPVKLISGGPMMGVAMFDLDIPITKTSAGIVCLSEKDSKTPEEQNCIRCGKCVQTCPMTLMPLELNQFTLLGQMDMFEKYHGLDCIECGSCSYICPAKRFLAQTIRSAKRNILSVRK